MSLKQYPWVHLNNFFVIHWKTKYVSYLDESIPARGFVDSNQCSIQTAFNTDLAGHKM